MRKGSRLLVAALLLEAASSEIFGVCGEEKLDVLESLHSWRIEFVLTRHRAGGRVLRGDLSAS